MTRTRNGQFSIEWVDAGREPQCDPDPAYPDGKRLQVARAGQKACRVNLPYPARRCGQYVVMCGQCGLAVVITTAGRPDDPKSASLPCKGA